MYVDIYTRVSLSVVEDMVRILVSANTWRFVICGHPCVVCVVGEVVASVYLYPYPNLDLYLHIHIHFCIRLFVSVNIDLHLHVLMSI